MLKRTDSMRKLAQEKISKCTPGHKKKKGGKSKNQSGDSKVKKSKKSHKHEKSDENAEREKKEGALSVAMHKAIGFTGELRDDIKETAAHVRYAVTKDKHREEEPQEFEGQKKLKKTRFRGQIKEASDLEAALAEASKEDVPTQKKKKKKSKTSKKAKDYSSDLDAKEKRIPSKEADTNVDEEAPKRKKKQKKEKRGDDVVVEKTKKKKKKSTKRKEPLPEVQADDGEALKVKKKKKKAKKKPVMQVSSDSDSDSAVAAAKSDGESDSKSDSDSDSKSDSDSESEREREREREPEFEMKDREISETSATTSNKVSDPMVTEEIAPTPVGSTVPTENHSASDEHDKARTDTGGSLTSSPSTLTSSSDDSDSEEEMPSTIVVEVDTPSQVDEPREETKRSTDEDVSPAVLRHVAQEEPKEAPVEALPGTTQEPVETPQPTSFAPVIVPEETTMAPVVEQPAAEPVPESATQTTLPVQVDDSQQATQDENKALGIKPQTEPEEPAKCAPSAPEPAIPATSAVRKQPEFPKVAPIHDQVQAEEERLQRVFKKSPHHWLQAPMPLRDTFEYAQVGELKPTDGQPAGASAHAPFSGIKALLPPTPKAVPKVDILSPESSRSYALEELQHRPPPAELDRTRLQDYLAEGEFAKLFGMDRVAFSKQPVWKQKSLKANYGLF